MGHSFLKNLGIPHGGWSPTAFGGGLMFWAEAVYNAVWTDKSPTHYAITEAGTPDYTSVQTPNGHAAILFDGSTDYYTVDSMAANFAGSDIPYAAAFVFRATNSVATPTLFAAGNSADADSVIQLRRATAALEHYRRDDGATLASRTVAAQFTATATWYLLIESFTGTTINHWLNGTQISTAAALNVGLITLNRLTIGALRLNLGPSQYWLNAMAMALFLNRTITTSEVTQLQAYVKRQYGVPSS